MTIPGIFGPPGPQARLRMALNYVFQGAIGFLEGGGYIDGAKSRDITNTYSLTAQLLLNTGLLMGKVTSSGLWAPSVPFGVTAGALTQAGTTITLSAAGAVELVRRNGAAGNLTLIGPASANGTARKGTLAYSAVNTSTGVVTLTSIGANQVDQIDLAPAATGGNLKLTVQKTDGTFVTTANIAWNATDATYLASINSALDTATGVVGGIVASAIPAVDTDLGFRLTYSGTGYAGNSWAPASVNTFPTTVTAWSTWRVTNPVAGAFVAGSLVGAADGSEDPRSIIADKMGVTIGVDLGAVPAYAPWPWIPVQGTIKGSQVINWPTDTGIRDYIIAQMGRLGGGEFVWDTKF